MGNRINGILLRRAAFVTGMGVLLAGCNGFSLSSLFPGIVIPGTGAVTVKRIVTTDPPGARTNIIFPLGVDLTDGAGFRWDIEDDGHVTDGGNADFPDAFDRYVSAIPEEERGNFLQAYHKRLTSPDRETRLKAARAWARWEGETISIAGPSALPSRFNEDRFVEAFARIENHYFMNDGFFETDGWLLDQVPRMRHIPCRIAHGRYDMCTPMASAWALKQRWPEAELEIIHDAGHSSLEPGIIDALVRGTDAMLTKGLW